ncbi:MFS transporter [Ligilactobacillus animalis]|nr:MFS transporter [Ligilactobacillus animalis]
MEEENLGPWYRQVTKKQWKSLFAATTGYFLDGFDFNMVNLLLIPIAHEFGIPLILSSTLVSAAYLSRWFGGMLFGAIGDKFGRKVSMIVSIFFYAGGTFICAFAPAFWVLFAARLFIGLGMAGEYSSSTTYVMETWPKNMRNKAVGFVVAGFSLGGAVTAQVYKLVSHLTAGTSLEPHAWRIFFALGIIPVMFALWMRRSVSESSDYEEMKRQQEEIAKQDPNYEPPRDMFSVLFRTNTKLTIFNVFCTIMTFVLLVFVFLLSSKLSLIQSVIAWILIFATMFSFTRQFMKKRWPIGVGILVIIVGANLINGPMQALMPTYYEQALHFSTSTTANLTSVFWIGQVIGCIIVGFVGDKLGTRRAAWVGEICSLVVMIPVFMVTREMMDQSSWWMVVFVVFLMAYEAFIAFAALIPKFIGSYFTTANRNAGVGFLVNAGGLGQALAPVLTLSLASSVFEPMGLGLGWTLFSVLTVMTLVVITCLLINLPTRLQKLIHPEEIREQDWVDHDISDVADEVRSEANK